MECQVGGVVAVSIEADLYCYIRKYAFGHGVLPFLSKGGIITADQIPTLKAGLFFDIWVYRDETTPMSFVGAFPFTNPEESYGEQAYCSAAEILRHRWRNI